MNKERLLLLLKAYLDHTISEEDCRELMTRSKDINLEEVDELINRELQEINTGPQFTGAKAESVLSMIKKDPRFVGKNKYPAPSIYKRLTGSFVFRIAAILVVALFTLLYVIRSRDQKTRTGAMADQPQVAIAPGTKKAMLILENGEKITLNDAKVGELANEGNVSIRKTGSGQLIYDLSKPLPNSRPSAGYNTIQTPNGGEYHVILPDGTKVWLNSASSLRFPTNFSTAAREVTLKGEAYFEVSHRKSTAFHVNVKGALVEVLGTHFNICAYEDDADFATTLLEGSVRVSKNNRKSLLVPGQQSLIMDGSDRIAVKSVDTAEAMAWHNGYFSFKDEDISSILKKVSRWYDVEVEYRNSKPGQKLGGMSYRTKSLNDLLDQLEKIGNLHFKLEGRRIIVVD